MKVYYMKVKSINADDEKWFKYLSQKRIEKVNRLKKANKKSQSIGAELLLNYAVNGDIKKTVKWDTENGGKLYLTQNKDLYVNLSHSGGYAVCAVHNKDVGIDIQHLRECDMNLAKRFFTAEETEYINCSADKNNAFFEVWTKKESFVKAIGLKSIRLEKTTIKCLSAICRSCRYLHFRVSSLQFRHKRQADLHCSAPTE